MKNVKEWKNIEGYDEMNKYVKKLLDFANENKPLTIATIVFFIGWVILFIMVENVALYLFLSVCWGFACGVVGAEVNDRWQ
jgi:hypothetical protein